MRFRGIRLVEDTERYRSSLRVCLKKKRVTVIVGLFSSEKRRLKSSVFRKVLES